MDDLPSCEKWYEEDKYAGKLYATAVGYAVHFWVLVFNAVVSQWAAVLR